MCSKLWQPLLLFAVAALRLAPASAVSSGAPIPIPADLAVPPGSIDKAVSGFQVRTALVKLGNPERAEQELAGELGANLADPLIFNSDGYYLETQVINYLDSGDPGNFDGDVTFPGVTGDNFALEVLTFI